MCGFWGRVERARRRVEGEVRATRRRVVKAVVEDREVNMEAIVSYKPIEGIVGEQCRRNKSLNVSNG